MCFNLMQEKIISQVAISNLGRAAISYRTDTEVPAPVKFSNPGATLGSLAGFDPRVSGLGRGSTALRFLLSPTNAFCKENLVVIEVVVCLHIDKIQSFPSLFIGQKL